jgi:hypothetical protein
MGQGVPPYTNGPNSPFKLSFNASVGGGLSYANTIKEATGSGNRKLTFMYIGLQKKQSNIELHTTPPDGSNPMHEMNAWFAQKKMKRRG